MTTLTSREREVVAIGASVGAGCHPCLSHHIRNGRGAGLTDAELVGVVLQGHALVVAAADWLLREGLAMIGVQVSVDSASPDLRLRELAGLGAAMAANAMSDIEERIRGAGSAGLSIDELAETAAVAHDVQANAARIHARKTLRLLDGDRDHQAATPPAKAASRSDADDEPCGCDAEEPRRDGASPDSARDTAADRRGMGAGPDFWQQAMASMMANCSGMPADCCNSMEMPFTGASMPSMNPADWCGCAPDAAAEPRSSRL